jgi:hypothetical protein
VWGHSDISWKFEIIGSWVGTGGQGGGPGIQAKVFTELRRHGFPYVFCTFVSSVLRTKLSKIPRNFRQFHTEYGSQKTTSVDTLIQAIGREMAARRN